MPIAHTRRVFPMRAIVIFFRGYLPSESQVV